MNVFFGNLLKFLRKLYQNMMLMQHSTYIMPEDIGLSPEQSSDIVFNKLNSDAPCMVARFGSTELLAIQNCLAVESSEHSALKYIRGQQPQWWWMDSAIKQLERWSGFFPSNPETISRFTRLMIEDSKELDVLALWIGHEKAMPLPQHCKFIHLLMLEPYWSSKPWSKALEGKNVVVVHPFAELIENQYYNHRTELFDNPDTLPEFNLRTVKAVQSLGGECEYKDWFEALQWMEKEIDKEDYDICLIGCGAYGFPLAAHCKRHGKKAVHMGGALQLLFGIKGNRWENPNYARNWHMKPENYYLKLFLNKVWIRPDAYRTETSKKVEGACYW